MELANASLMLKCRMKMYDELSQEILVEINQFLALFFPIELFFNGFSTVVAHFNGLFGMFLQPFYGIGNVLWLFGVDTDGKVILLIHLL